MDKLIEAIDIVKTKLTDAEYMDIMNALTEVHKQYGNDGDALYMDSLENITTSQPVPGVDCMFGGLKVLYNHDLYGSVEVLYGKGPTIERFNDEVDRQGISDITITYKPSDTYNVGDFTCIEKLPYIRIYGSELPDTIIINDEELSMHDLSLV